MVTVEYWIQLENRPWDQCPNKSQPGGIDRITGQTIKDVETVGATPGPDPVNLTLHSPTGASHPVTMNKPLRKGNEVVDALILRRYKPPQKQDQSDAWTIPDDRKINPWDLNEPDPTDTGTMGTIPGPVIECNVGDSVIVHFRNMDNRTMLGTQKVCFPFPFIGEICFPIPVPVPIPIEKRVHSLHPHGFVFGATSDGAYPLSPPDPAQPIPASEGAAWASVPGFSGQFKKGDRVPPGGTFTYTWNTLGWPTTAGVWLYHDHSICDMENVELGAIGIIVIHNPADTQQEVDIRAGDPQDPSKLDPAFLPGGSPNGSPTTLNCFPLPRGIDVGILPHDLEMVGSLNAPAPPPQGHEMSRSNEGAELMAEPSHKPKPEAKPPKAERALMRGDLILGLDEKLQLIRNICFRVYRTPPAKALYLQLFHTLQSGATCINGRQYLGNTPTIVAGPNTRMRFGVVGMGSEFHTFHIHGHRWIIPGPDGNNPTAIQNSAQVKAVSQFEDTRTFGPANSFVFTVDEGNGFMRASPAIGEWHMHCHVLAHMMSGMMGSLLVINGGELVTPLPKGVPCDQQMGGGMNGMGNGPQIITVRDFAFTPSSVSVAAGSQVTFDFQQGTHTVQTVSTNNATAININNGGGNLDAVPAGQQRTVTINGSAGGQISYQCGIHTTLMTGTINLT